MADRMWGGVPFTIPSKTAMKYLSGAVKVPRESAIEAGGRYNARQTMDREIPGHRVVRREMKDSYENYEKQRFRARTEPKQEQSSGKVFAPGVYEAGMDPIHYHNACGCCNRSTLTRCPMFRINKPGAGIGWTEPRHEASLGFVDRRRHLPGYVGGKKLRETLCAGGRGY